jgi:hypothetical protein
LRQVLLGIDFIGSNWRTALSSIEQWWQFTSASTQHSVLLGISNFCRRRESLPGSADITPESVHQSLTSLIPAGRLAHWTSDIDAEVLAETRKKGFRSIPLYSEFNYGSAVNRLLLMAHARGCQYLVRVDPGTCPPAGVSFDMLMDEHERSIGDNVCAVVSRQYADRLALRQMFVKEGRELAHRRLVQEATGIPVDAQVTAGAMFTQKTPGVPAVCFPPPEQGLTLVWASDDGIYQTLPRTKASSRVLPFWPVRRFDPVGKTKSSLEYYRGIAGGVFLHSLEGHAGRGEAESELNAFIHRLKTEMLDPAKCSQNDNNPEWSASFCRENLAPSDFLDAIEIGHANHTLLLRDWDETADALRSLVRDLV